MKIYCDTSVYLDYFHSRKDKFRPLGEFAFNFFRKGWRCNFQLIISDWLLHELRKHIRNDEIDEILIEFEKRDKLIHAEQIKTDWESANNYKHPDDALHAILARREKADVLVTRNRRDFSDIDFIDVLHPETV